MVKKIIALVLCVLVFFGMIALLIMINSDYAQTEYDTPEYSATVTNVAIRGTGEDISVNIYTKEYSTSLYVSPDISKHLNINAFRELKAGDKVSFRPENVFEGQLNNGLFVVLTSLKISGNDIFTVDEYNTYMSIEAKPTIIVCVIAIVVSFGLSVWCAVRIKKAVKQRNAA